MTRGSGGYKGLQGLRRVTGGDKGLRLQGVTTGYRAPGDDKGLQGVTGGYKG